MSSAGLPESQSDAPEAPPHKTAGAWIGYLIFGLILLYLIVTDAQAAYESEWANVTGITVFALAFVIVPTGGLRWLRHRALARKPPAGGESQ
jgi:hypothetical protein